MTNNHNIPSEINKVESEESTLYIGLTTTSPNQRSYCQDRGSLTDGRSTRFLRSTGAIGKINEYSTLKCKPKELIYKQIRN